MFVILTPDTLYSGCIYNDCFNLSHIVVYLPIECYNRKEEIKMNKQWNYLGKSYPIERTNQYNKQWNHLREGNNKALYNTPIESDLIERNHLYHTNTNPLRNTL